MTTFPSDTTSFVPALCEIYGAHMRADKVSVGECLTIDSYLDQAPPHMAQLLASSIVVRIPKEAKDIVASDMRLDEFLPRLPFPITLFELYDQDGDANYFTETWGHELWSMIVLEAIPGRQWHMFGLFGPSTNEIVGWSTTGIVPKPPIGMMQFCANDDGVIAGTQHPGAGNYGPFMDCDPSAAWTPLDADGLREFMACAQLATARGTQFEPYQRDDESRQVRRARKREQAKKPFPLPTIYDLVIGGRYSTSDARGDSGRKYSCRWLVRGHWRSIHGRRQTWIDPYIKGPADAPFKGRPRYTVKEPV